MNEYQKEKRRSINIDVETKKLLDNWIIKNGELISYAKAIKKLIEKDENK